MNGEPNTFAVSAEELRELRRKGGLLLKRRRELLGFTQKELAQRVGLEPYSIVDQLEHGRGRIEPHQYAEWAEAGDVPGSVEFPKRSALPTLSR